MELIVTVPDSYPAERDYILSVIFNEFLGVDYRIKFTNQKKVLISAKDRQQVVIMPDGLFSTPIKLWLSPESLPKQPLKVWDPRSVGIEGDIGLSPLPVIYGNSETDNTCIKHEHNDANILIPIDILGSCFFMLTRYEEIVKTDRDQHGRFPTNAMLAKQEGFIERPIVNEYVEILWACLKKLCPGLEKRRREYRLCISHDVDEISFVIGKPLKRVIRRIVGDIIIRRDLNLAFRSAGVALHRDAERDPCNTFDFIMELSDRHGIQSTFNFMAEFGHSEYDRRYFIDHPWIREILRRIIRRGHLIGFHPTYGSYLKAEQLKAEFMGLRKAAEEEGAQQEQWGGRQHYLRWHNPATWQHWENAGIDYDSTIGFSDLIGFRAGCCYEYSVFNLKKREQLRLIERPLIIMEGTVLSKIGTFQKETMPNILQLNHICKKFKGDFTLLWHSNNLISRRQRDTYHSILAYL